MSGLQEEVIRAQGSTVAVEAARAETVRAAVASTQEAAVARERAEASIKKVEAPSTLAERESQERVLKEETESATSLVIVHGEADESAQRVALLEGEFMDAHQTRDMAKANFQGVSDRAINANLWREDADR
jgi:prophage DNA circulation protein